jgi:hypothetical protein
MQSVHLTGQKRQTVFGKQKHLPLGAGVLIEHADRLLPRPMLRIAQFTKVEHMAVDRTRTVDAARLHNRPRPMRFPILLADTALQKHAASIERRRRPVQRVGRHYKAFRECPRCESTGYVLQHVKKKAVFPASSGSRARAAPAAAEREGPRATRGSPRPCRACRPCPLRPSWSPEARYGVRFAA